MRLSIKVAKHIAPKLGYYVYIYVNPIDGSVFYVGKGKGPRALAHWDDAGNKNVRATIRNIRSLGKEPIIQLIAHSLKKEHDAFMIESSAIEVLGKKQLCNLVRGRRSRDVEFQLKM